MSHEKRSKREILEEEFLRTTETLWNNEVQANIYVTKIMVGTSILAIVMLALNLLNVFTIDKTIMTPTLILVALELLVPALLCLKLKGDKPWLKSLLLFFYTLIFARLFMTLGHNVVLCLVFPVVLSIRYYSPWVTSTTAILTVLFSGVAEFLGVKKAFGRLDLNMVELPGGLSLQTPGKEFVLLRDIVPMDLIDRNQLWLHTLQHSFLPKLVLYILIAVICVRVAAKGREAIFAQKEETEKTQRISTELNLASEIQNNVLPNIFPVYPDRKEFNLYASMTPAKEVGGDFYDFFMVDPDHICLVMADVSGKGVPAALFMMVSRTIIKNLALSGLSPSEILEKANNQLCEGNVAELFVTVWLGIIEISTGKGVAVNAGHEHPAIKKKDAGYDLIVYKHSPAVAAMEGMPFKQHEFHLDPGDSIFVYTDGVAEATSAENELFGTERMLEALNKDPNASPQDTLTNVMEGINAFVKEAEQFDDITMLCFRYNGPDAEEK